ncbi:RtcB family protein [bacterium]|nr:RtcB family protein [bacterium]
MISKKDFIKINDYLWEIPKSFRPDMRVPARIYVSEKMLEDCFRDKSLLQLVNTTTLPGIVKYALAMPDAHEGYGFCLKGDTKILSNFGFYLPIKDFQKKENAFTLKIVDLKLKKLVEASIQKFLKIKPKNKVFKVITKTGREIVATEDHPFYTPKGMVVLEKLNPGDKIAIFPFEGVPYEAPSDEVIIDEKDIKKTLNKIGVKEDTPRFRIILQKLKKRSLLPLTYNHPKLPYLLKIMGFVFGDGTMNFIGKRGDGIVGFYGRKEDLEEAREDIKRIGYKPSPFHFRKGKGLESGKSSDFCSFVVNASSLVVLLESLGVPRGRKVDQPFRVPKWIFKCPLWQKRLFLAALFGSELRCPHRRLDRKGNFNAPSFPLGKRIELLNNAKDYLKDIEKLLKDFGVKTLYIEQPKNKKHINTKGKVSWGLNLVISPALKNLLNLWGKIGFEYNKERNFFANVAIQYLRFKQQVLQEKEKAIKYEIPRLLQSGLSYQKIATQLATGNPLTKRFIIDVCWKLKKGIKVIKPRIPANFLLFKEYLQEVTQGLGQSGLVWDEIKEIKKVPCSRFVYDFTINHPSHNFIANNFVVSNCIGGVAATKYPDGAISPGGIGFDQNCGVRLLKSEYTEKEIRPYLEKLATEIQKEVPSGLGRGRQIKLSIEQINRILEGGVPYLVEKGY